MRTWSTFYLALIVALAFALLGIYYLIPNVYHPLSADTFTHTTPHLKYALGFFFAAVLALVLGRFVRPELKA